MARRYSQQEKEQALEALGAGSAVTAVAAEFGISATTLRRWLKAAKATAPSRASKAAAEVAAESAAEAFAETPAEEDSHESATVSGETDASTDAERDQTSVDDVAPLLQLVVIDKAGDAGRIARILRNENLPITLTRLSEHAIGDQVAEHFGWRKHSWVLELDAAGMRRVLDLLQRSGRPLPRVLISSDGQFECSDCASPSGNTPVIADATTALLGTLLEAEHQLDGLRARLADSERHIRQLHACYQRDFDMASEPIAIVGLTGHRYANPAYLRLLGYRSAAELDAVQFTRLVADRSLQDYLQTVDALDGSGASGSLDLALHCGTRVQAEVTRLPGSARELLLHFRSVPTTRNNPVLSRPGAGDIARSLVETSPAAETVQPEVSETAVDQAEWKAHILKALQDPQLFSLLYQPIVGLAGGPSHMYEALLRLRDSSGTEYLPGKFIPAAEQAGLMHRVDQWVITQAIKTILSQGRLDATVTLCVNLSLASLQDEAFPEWLRKTVGVAGIDAGRLVLEISRGDLTPDLSAAQRSLRAIRAIGCAIVLDDFSIESADSGLLSTLKVDFVKLDRTLVLEVARSEMYQERIRKLVTAAGKAGVKTIAPYVQEAASVSRLWSCGVDYVQGYFLQHPSQALDYDFGEEEHEVPSTQWAIL